MTADFIYFLNTFLFIRLFLQWNDHKTAFGGKNALFYIVQIILLSPFLFPLRLSGFILIGLFVIYHVFVRLSEKYIKDLFLPRLLQLFLLLLSGSVVFGLLQNQIGIAPSILHFIGRFWSNNAFTSEIPGIPGFELTVVVFAVFICMNEMNNLIRFILGLIKARPLDEHDQEPNRHGGGDRAVLKQLQIRHCNGYPAGLEESLCLVP